LRAGAAIPTVKRRQRALRQVYFTAQESIEFRIPNETRELETPTGVQHFKASSLITIGNTA
jgi:hypothetical protein